MTSRRNHTPPSLWYRLAALCAAVALGSNVPQPARSEPQPEFGILLVGSSLVRGVRRPLQSIFESRGIDARVRASAPALATLAYHAGSTRTDALIRQRPWDVVLLQENGDGMAEGLSYMAARQLYGKIGPTSARAMFFMTWRERDVAPSSEAWNQLKGQPGESVGYVPIAHELGVGVTPVGWAVRQARINLGESPSVDLWKGVKGRHLSRPGQYLAACVVFAAVTGSSPRGVWTPRWMSSEIADFFQSVALDIVMNDLPTWNLPAEN